MGARLDGRMDGLAARMDGLSAQLAEHVRRGAS